MIPDPKEIFPLTCPNAPVKGVKGGKYLGKSKLTSEVIFLCFNVHWNYFLLGHLFGSSSQFLGELEP